MKIYTAKQMLRAGLVGGTLGRHSGNMREPANQQAAYKELGIDPAHILHLHQIHSDKIISVFTSQEAQSICAAPLPDADAWLLAPIPRGWGAAILTADCVPLFLWNAAGTHAALAHCGWRGVVQGLPAKAAQALRKQNTQLPLFAWLGPHIQACCFEVQEDVSSQFPQDCVTRKDGKIFVNLTAAITRQLTQAGLPAQNIQAPDYCTCGDSENFFSWRRDHQKNLLLSFIYRP